MTVEDRIARLERDVARLIEDVRSLPDEVLYREPSDGEWSIMSNLAHVAEMLPYWAHQAEAIAGSPGARFGRTHDDPLRIGAIEAHSNDVLEQILAQIGQARDECVRVLRALPADAWLKAGEHPNRGSMTVEQTVDAFISRHLSEHVKQVEAARDAVIANPSA